MSVKDTFTPQPIRDLKVYLEGQGATISIARFCEPNTGRQFRGYHLGKSQIMVGDPGDGCPPSGSADYSIQTNRDKAGLSEARAAIDIQFGKLKLQAYSKWLLTQAQSNAPGTSDWRELIFSPDGAVVLRWDRERGVNSPAKPGEADDSHLFHTHVSFYRDSENREKVTPFRGFFEPAPPPGDTVTPEQIKALQTFLNKHGANPPLVVDGVYGPKTSAALVQVDTLLVTKETQAATVIEAQKNTIAGKNAKMSEGLAIK